MTFDTSLSCTYFTNGILVTPSKKREILSLPYYVLETTATRRGNVAAHYVLCYWNPLVLYWAETAEWVLFVSCGWLQVLGFDFLSHPGISSVLLRKNTARRTSERSKSSPSSASFSSDCYPIRCSQRMKSPLILQWVSNRIYWIQITSYYNRETEQHTRYYSSVMSVSEHFTATLT